MNNKDLSIAFCYIRNQTGENKKGTSEIARSIASCPFSIYDYYHENYRENRSPEFGYLQNIYIAENVGRATLIILEIILRSKTKEDALYEYRRLLKRGRSFTF